MRYQKRRILTPNEREMLENEVETSERQLQTPDVVGIGNGDGTWGRAPIAPELVTEGRIRSELAKRKQILQNGQVGSLTRAEKMQIGKKIKQLEEHVGKNLAPRKQFFHEKVDEREYHKTVAHVANVEMNPKFVEKVQELKNLRRMRDSDNPLAGETDSLRST